MKNLKIFWLVGKHYHAGNTEMQWWKDYLAERDWNFTDNYDEADIVFFGSQSTLDEKYLSDDKFKILYFWGIPYFRLVDRSYMPELERLMKMVEKCDIIISSSMTTALQMFDFGFENMTLYPCIDDRTIDKVPEQEKLNRVCVISRLTPHKMVESVIRAVALTKNKPELFIIGIGDDYDYLKYAEELGVKCTIKDLGDEEKFTELKRSKILVSASVWESFNLPTAEALYCGIPAIVRDIPLFAEVYKGNVNYFRTEEQLALLIDDILDNYDKLEPAGLKESVERYTSKRACDRMEEFFGYVIKQVLRKKLDKNKEDRAEYKKIYDIEHERDWKYSSYMYSPDFERHWRVQHVVEVLTGKTVADIGCSYGAYTINFARNGFKVTGVDCSSIALEQCKTNIKKFIPELEKDVELVEAFADDLPFEDNKFDSAYYGEILEHIPEHLLAKSLREAVRIVKPQGRIIITTPFRNMHDDVLHLRHYDIGGFKQFILKEIEDKVNILKLDLIAENGKEPSCIFCVLEKK